MAVSERNPPPVVLAASLLAAHPRNYEQALNLCQQSHIQWIHADVMDGHFVPNLSFGPALIADLAAISPLPFEAHLMIDNPKVHLHRYLATGARQIILHSEHAHCAALVEEVKAATKMCGIAISPKTAVTDLIPILGHLDLALVMTVEPGFGGQDFMPQMLPKIEQLARLREQRGLKFQIGVDGGINPQTAALCRQRGASHFIAGSYLFGALDMVQAACALRASIHGIKPQSA